MLKTKLYIKVELLREEILLLPLALNSRNRAFSTFAFKQALN